MESGSESSTRLSQSTSSPPSSDRSSSPSSSDTEPLPKSTSEWKSNFTDKLGIHYVHDDFEKIIISRWCLVPLTAKDIGGVEACLNACNSCNLALELDFDSLDDMHPNLITHVSKIVKKHSNEWWAVYLRSDPLLNDYENQNRFLVKMNDFSLCLEQMVSDSKMKRAISEWKYQTLFEKLLQAFGINTLSQPFISKTKAMIMGHTMSSLADILCVQHSPANERKILCVCELVCKKFLKVKKSVFMEVGQLSPIKCKLRSASCDASATPAAKKTITIEAEDNSPPKKKWKMSPQTDAAIPLAENKHMVEGIDISLSEENIEGVSSSASSYIGIQGVWAQHIGELFVHLDKSVKDDGILGITIEKTWVRFTYLEVEETCMKKIRDTPANRRGSVKLEDWERPRFCYSKRLNILKQAGRADVFKGLLLIRSMQEKISKIQ